MSKEDANNMVRNHKDSNEILLSKGNDGSVTSGFGGLFVWSYQLFMSLDR